MTSIRNILLGPKPIIIVVVLTIIAIACAEVFVFTPGYAERTPSTSQVQSPQEFHRGLLAAQNSDYENAFNIWNRLASNGDRWGRYGLGLLYWNGDGVPKNRSVALDLLNEAAKTGLHEAQYRLGRIYLSGDGVEQDFPVALDWFRKAARQGHAGAHYHLSEMYAKGWGVPQDMQTALMWVSIAAVGGNEVAKAVWENALNGMSDAEMEAIVVRVQDCVASGFEECGRSENHI